MRSDPSSILRRSEQGRSTADYRSRDCASGEGLLRRNEQGRSTENGIRGCVRDMASCEEMNKGRSTDGDGSHWHLLRGEEKREDQLVGCDGRHHPPVVTAREGR